MAHNNKLLDQLINFSFNTESNSDAERVMSNFSLQCSDTVGG